jgi:catechol 2,3-dioxygenase-like lactoylglutathione lyase family enzyme
MKAEIMLQHVALECSDKNKAEIFFTKILEIPKVKSFILSGELSDSIFGKKSSVEIDVYDNGRARFEVFFSENSKHSVYEHICIEVKSKNELIDRCKNFGIKPIVIKKEGKDLLFVRDFSDNLYEIKEKQLS